MIPCFNVLFADPNFVKSYAINGRQRNSRPLSWHWQIISLTGKAARDEANISGRRAPHREN